MTVTLELDPQRLARAIDLLKIRKAEYAKLHSLCGVEDKDLSSADLYARQTMMVRWELDLPQDEQSVCFDPGPREPGL